MNDYKKLYKQLLDLKNGLLKRDALLASELDNYKEMILDIDGDIKETEKKQEEKDKIHNIIANYKRLLLDELKEVLKFSGILFGVIAFGGASILPLFNLGFESIYILYSLLLAFSLTSAIGGALYLSATKDIRKTHKEYQGKEYELIQELKSLDKQLNKNNSDKLYYQEKIQEVKDAQAQNKGNIMYTSSQIRQLDEKVPFVEHVCRDDEEAINDVYAADLEVESAIKLVRENS